MKRHPSKIFGIPSGALNAASNREMRSVDYVPADQLTEEETFAGLKDGTIRAWRHDGYGRHWVQIVAADLAHETIAGVSPDWSLMADRPDDDELEDDDSDDEFADDEPDDDDDEEFDNGSEVDDEN